MDLSGVEAGHGPAQHEVGHVPAQHDAGHGPAQQVFILSYLNILKQLIPAVVLPPPPMLAQWFNDSDHGWILIPEDPLGLPLQVYKYKNDEQ